MRTPQEAWSILALEIKPLETCVLPLEETLGAYLAEQVVADRDIPPANRAAMDGYAARASDLAVRGARLIVDGEVAAGSAFPKPVSPGHCARIFTGANLPPNTDTVIPVEKTSTKSFQKVEREVAVEVFEPQKSGANVFRRGENARAGELLIDVGERIGPRQIGLAAATGHGTLRVYRPPRISIVNTGAELLDCTAPAADYQVRNSNGPLLVAALKQAGIGTVACRTAPDKLDLTVHVIQEAVSNSDAVIVTGGISAGRHDYVPLAIEKMGATLLYRSVAMKPGKPQLFARTSEGKLIFGLPGNPLSCVVGLYELVLPALRLLGGCAPESCRPLMFFPLGKEIEYRGDRQWVCPAKLIRNGESTHVLPCPPVGSADLVTASKADGAVLLEPNSGVLEAGEIVPFRPWVEMLVC